MATEHDCLHVRSILEIKEFAEAIRAVLLEEAESKVEQLMKHVRAGLMADATRVEAEIAILHKIPDVLRKYADKARVSRA